MTVARELGLDPVFVGAAREVGIPQREIREGWSIERIGRFFPLVNGTRPLLYIWSVLGFWRALFVHLVKNPPVVVHASDFEPYWPARVYAFLARIPLIYNIHDNLAQRYQCPSWAAAILNALEGAAVLCSTVTLVPEEFRATALPSWCQHKVRVVRNGPIDPGYFPPGPENQSTRAFYAGWLDRGRGLDHALEMVNTTPQMTLRVAGSGDDEIVRKVSSTPRVSFLGYLEHDEALRRTVEADFVVALYDPIRPINRFAASNKVAEALAVGRPPIVNREMKVAELLEAEGAAVVVEYASAGAVGQHLVELRADHERYKKMCEAARRVYESHYSWGAIRRASIAAFDEVGVDGSGRKPEQSFKPRTASTTTESV